MAKGEARNPAEAYRKAQKKKEVKKNKAERGKARELSTVKTDTSAFEEEIAQLESKASRTTKDNQRLEDLRAEVTRIQKKKEEYVAQHPEHRKMVYRSGRRHDEEDRPKVAERKNIFDKHGRPRHPERSIYFDSVFNPYGAPPPGMPYLERPPLPGEKYSDQEDESDESQAEDGDITLPDTPPPGIENDSDEDIELPDGPPPGKELELPLEAPLLPPPLPLQRAGFATQALFPPTPAFVSQAPVMYSSGVENAPPRAMQPLPPKPSPASVSAIISAEPELRDLRKESTAFVPSTLKRKKAAASKVDSRPDVGALDVKPAVPEERPDLLKTLQARLGTNN